jgi:hypothetical protein
MISQNMRAKNGNLIRTNHYAIGRRWAFRPARALRAAENRAERLSPLSRRIDRVYGGVLQATDYGNSNLAMIRSVSVNAVALLTWRNIFARPCLD